MFNLNSYENSIQKTRLKKFHFKNQSQKQNFKKNRPKKISLKTPSQKQNCTQKLNPKSYKNFIQKLYSKYKIFDLNKIKTPLNDEILPNNENLHPNQSKTQSKYGYFNSNMKNSIQIRKIR